MTATEHLELKNVEEKPLRPDEVKVKMKYAGICGTDNHLYHGQPGSAVAEPPIILGHENSGVIAELGAEVKSDLQIGDRVAIDPNIPCGFCSFCRHQLPQLCEHNEAIGVTRNGGMAEYVNVPETNVYKIPDNLSLKAAAMAEPVSCVVHGLDELVIKPDITALVIGDGFVGQIFTELLAKRVKSVAVSGHNPKKVALLKKIGASEVFNPEEVPHSATYDIVIECVGLPGTQEQAIRSASRGGQILMFGVTNPGGKIQVSGYDIYFKEFNHKRCLY